MNFLLWISSIARCIRKSDDYPVFAFANFLVLSRLILRLSLYTRYREIVYIEAEVREAMEDPRPIREYAWVPVIRLHLSIPSSLARTPPRIFVSLTRTKRNAPLGNDGVVVRRRGSGKKCRCNRRDDVLTTTRVFLNHRSLTSLVLKNSRAIRLVIGKSNSIVPAVDVVLLYEISYKSAILVIIQNNRNNFDISK